MNRSQTMVCHHPSIVRLVRNTWNRSSRLNGLWRCSANLVALLATAILVTALLVTVGCNSTVNDPADTAAGVDGAPQASTARPLRIVVTIGMLSDLVKQIGGEQVVVQTLMGEGIDPHLYKPTRGDVQAIVQADVVFYCGLMLEGKMSDTLAVLGKDKRVVAIGDHLPADKLIGMTGENAHPDPHVWMDVALWSQSLDTIVETLAELRPMDRSQLQQRSDELRARMQRVHEYGQTVLQTIPPQSRLLVTSHDAFSYFGRAYGIEVAGVQGISTESEAGLQRINELVDLLVARHVPSVFVESSVPQKSLESIVRGARSRGLKVQMGGPLYSDAMGPKDALTGTYLGMMVHNFEIIAAGLGGTVDPLLRPK